MNKYYYGVDYKLIRLFCKIKDVTTYYEIQSILKAKFDYTQYYQVLVDDKENEIVEIEVFSNNKLVRLKIDYQFIDFGYFFENLEEQEKKEYEELPF